MLLTTLPRPFGRMPRHHPRRPDRISNAARGESRRFRIAKILLVCAEYNTICRMPSFCTLLFSRDCRNDSDQTAQPCRHEMRVAMGIGGENANMEKREHVDQSPPKSIDNEHPIHGDTIGASNTSMCTVSRQRQELSGLSERFNPRVSDTRNSMHPKPMI